MLPLEVRPSFLLPPPVAIPLESERIADMPHRLEGSFPQASQRLHLASLDLGRVDGA